MNNITHNGLNARRIGPLHAQQEEPCNMLTPCRRDPELMLWAEQIMQNICILDDTLRVLDEKLGPILSPMAPTDPDAQCTGRALGVTTEYSDIMARVSDRVAEFTARVQSLIERQQIS